MKFREYIADNLNILLANLFAIVLTEYLLCVFSTSLEFNIFIIFINLSTFIVCFLHAYFRKARFYKKIHRGIDALDQKILVHELIDPITNEEKLLHQEISELNRYMIDQINQYKIKFEDFKEYLELWVHEVKLPISALRLNLTQTKYKNNQLILSEIDRLDDYVNQILYLVRSEHVEKDYQISESSLSEIIKRVALKNQSALINSRIDFQVENVDKIIETDPKWLEFILNQIIANSIKYRKKKSPQIKVYSEETSKVLVLHVYDNGIGIPTSDQSRVFQKAFTGQNGRPYDFDKTKINLMADTSGSKSTGMGLYIVKKLIDKLGHRILISSTEYQYTDIMIVFAKNDYYKNVRNCNIKSTTE